MVDKLSFQLLDSTGAPLTGVVPTFVDYRNRSGGARTQPAIVELGGGLYGFTPTAADESVGTVFLVDGTAAAMPRRCSGAIYSPASPFIAFHLEQDGALWAGAAPTVGYWRDFAGAARTPPAVVAIAAYLFALTPSGDDLAVDVAFRIDSPALAEPPYFTGSLEAPSSSGAVGASPGASPETIVVDALLAYWRRYLPAKVAQLNALRAAVIKSALVQPFTVPTGAVLKLSSVGHEATPTSVTLPTGSVTAAQLVTAINAVPVPGMLASADSDGRLVLTATAAPALGAPSIAVVAQDTNGTVATGSNAALGWGEGGEHSETPALESPSWRGVVDGRAMTAPDMGQGFWVLLGNRTTRPTFPGLRRDLFSVVIAVEIWRPFSANAPPHRTREAISSAVRAVRELILTTDGRYLGREGAGDIQLADVTDVSISGDPIRLNEVSGVLFDTARLNLNVRVFQRPE